MKKIAFLLITLSIFQLSCNSSTEKDNIKSISIPTPNDWKNQTDFEINKNLNSFKLTDKELTSLIESNKGSIPVLVYMKYNPTEFAGPIPTIQVNLRPDQTKSLSELEKTLKSSIIQMSSYFQNFKIITPLQETEIGGLKGFMFMSQFDMNGNSGENWTIRSWSYVIQSGNYFYQINFSDTANEDSKKVYDKVLTQIRFK